MRNQYTILIICSVVRLVIDSIFVFLHYYKSNDDDCKV